MSKVGTKDLSSAELKSLREYLRKNAELFSFYGINLTSDMSLEDIYSSIFALSQAVGVSLAYDKKTKTYYLPLDYDFEGLSD